jgi:hypothetical protein
MARLLPLLNFIILTLQGGLCRWESSLFAYNWTETQIKVITRGQISIYALPMATIQGKVLELFSCGLDFSPCDIHTTSHQGRHRRESDFHQKHIRGSAWLVLPADIGIPVYSDLMICMSQCFWCLCSWSTEITSNFQACSYWTLPTWFIHTIWPLIADIWSTEGTESNTKINFQYSDRKSSNL